MKKVVTVVVLVIMLALTGAMLVGCTQGDYNYDIPDVLVVGYDVKFPPMGFRDEVLKKDAGFDLDLAEAVGAYLGVEMQFVAIDWDAKETMLKNGSIDLIWNGYTMSDERLKQVDFSVPYLRNAQIALVKVESSFQKLSDLTGKLLFMQLGSTAVDSYEQYDFLAGNTVDKLADNETCLTRLLADDDAAMITDKVLAKYKMQTEGYKGKFRILSEELEPEKYAVGIRKQDVALRIAINDALIELNASGKLLEIAEKWGVEDQLLL